LKERVGERGPVFCRIYFEYLFKDLINSEKNSLTTEFSLEVILRLIKEIYNLPCPLIYLLPHFPGFEMQRAKTI
jgi:hypothetical protein